MAGGGSAAMAQELITKAECAQRLRLTPGRISQMTAPGGPLAEAMVGRLVDWDRAVQLRAARADGARSQQPLVLPANHPPSLPPDNVVTLTEDDRRFKQARARKMEADADAAESARLERLGELVGRTAAEAEFFSLARMLRDQLMMLPSALAEDLAAITDPREVRVLLQRKLRETLAEVTSLEPMAGDTP